MSASVFYACAIRESGELLCWGEDWLSAEEMGGWTDAPAGRYRSVSAGMQYACAIGETGRLDCWGDRAFWADAPTGA